jgi:hypothetical protein
MDRRHVHDVVAALAGRGADGRRASCNHRRLLTSYAGSLQRQDGLSIHGVDAPQCYLNCAGANGADDCGGAMALVAALEMEELRR